jgi:hypothetical protein
VLHSARSAASRAAARPGLARLELLPCGGRLSRAGDAAVAAVSRPQGLSRRSGGAGRDDAAGADGGAGAAADGTRRGEPSDPGALAGAAAQRLRGQPVLEGSLGGVHAAGRSTTPPGLPAQALRGRRRGEARCSRSDQWRQHDARCVAGVADPQKTPVVIGRGVFYGPRSLTAEEHRRERETRSTGPRTMGAVALFGGGTAVGGAAAEGRTVRARQARRADMAASDHRRAGALWRLG